jgi:uncharacterized membrane protein
MRKGARSGGRMKKVEYIDPRGRKYLVLVENNESDEMLQYGIKVGPPEDIVDELGLPEDKATELHNQLYNRKLWSMKEVNRNPKAIFAALQAVFRVNQQMIVNAYLKYEQEPEES